MKVLFASSEIFPYAKSGGLADVADALPLAIKNSLDIVRVMPLYGFMDKSELIFDDNFEVNLAGISYEINIFIQKKDRVTTYFIQAPLLSSTQQLYGDENGDYANNDLRFAIFCMAITELALKTEVNLIHLNDWHTALVALFIKDRHLDIKTIFTIHNLAYQGIFEKNSLQRLAIDEKYFNMDGLEFYGNVNFLKAGIAYSYAITTVSPSYAIEILSQEFGCGLDGFLRYHKDKLTGILNGINYNIFNPKNDKYLTFNFDKNTLENKYKNKKDFIKHSTLKDPRVPLIVMISRLSEQKGVDLLINSINPLLKKRVNLFVIGEGNTKFRSQLLKISKKYDNFEFFDAYNEKLAHKLYAAADFLLMPSKFEPCGLNQMIAMNYGTIPIVHRVGGLKDSVHEDDSKCGNGIVFKKSAKKELLLAIDRALKLKKDSKKFSSIIGFNMLCDFSFAKNASKYIELYKKSLL